MPASNGRCLNAETFSTLVQQGINQGIGVDLSSTLDLATSTRFLRVDEVIVQVATLEVGVGIDVVDLPEFRAGLEDDRLGDFYLPGEIAYARTQAAENPQRVVVAAKSWLCHSGVDRHANFLPAASPEEVEFVALTAGVGTIQLYP